MTDRRDVNQMGKRALQDELISCRAENDALRAELADRDCIPRGEVEGILSRAIEAFAQEKMRQVEDAWTKVTDGDIQWHAQYNEFYGLISFISGAALAGRGKMLLAAIGETPDTGRGETNDQLRAVLEGSKDMIAELSGMYTSLVSRAEGRGKNTYQFVRDGWGHIVNQYLIGLNYLRNTGRDDLLVEAAARYSHEAGKLRAARYLLAPGIKSDGVDIKAFAVANVLALQDYFKGSQEDNIQRYVKALDEKTDRSDLENDVLTEILKSPDYVTKVRQWIQRKKPAEKRQINVSKN